MTARITLSLLRTVPPAEWIGGAIILLGLPVVLYCAGAFILAVCVGAP